jgi:hypothetical protein
VIEGTGAFNIAYSRWLYLNVETKQFYFLSLQKCTSKDVTVLKVFPETGCRQVERQVCGHPICPLSFDKEICENHERTVSNSKFKFVQKKL